MTPWQFIDCGMVEDHTPKCHQHQEKSVQQPLTKEFEVSRHACPSNQGWISNVDSLQQKTYPTAHSCNNFGIGFYVECWCFFLIFYGFYRKPFFRKIYWHDIWSAAQKISTPDFHLWHIWAASIRALPPARRPSSGQGRQKKHPRSINLLSFVSVPVFKWSAAPWSSNFSKDFGLNTRHQSAFNNIIFELCDQSRGIRDIVSPSWGNVFLQRISLRNAHCCMIMRAGAGESHLATLAPI